MRRRGAGLPGGLAAFDALPGASASDNCDDNLTYACTTGPLTGGACGGTITREHKVTDDCGNTKTCNQTITVDDNTLPSITCPDNITVECEDEVPACPASFAAFDALPGASASDNCDDNLTYACTTGPLTGGSLRGHDHAGTQSDGRLREHKNLQPDDHGGRQHHADDHLPGQRHGGMRRRGAGLPGELRGV
ncbi:MAG: hypothetical protein IPM81_20240 [Saprospirales bacterium]|nr:hypothetical protein [Saprospirales bacterium]